MTSVPTLHAHPPQIQRWYPRLMMVAEEVHCLWIAETLQAAIIEKNILRDRITFHENRENIVQKLFLKQKLKDQIRFLAYDLIFNQNYNSPFVCLRVLAEPRLTTSKRTQSVFAVWLLTCL